MGHFEGDVWIPDYLDPGGPDGWVLGVNADLEILATLAAGGGGGGGGSLNLIDITAAPYSADPTGDVAADDAISDAGEAMMLAGPGSGLWLPGIFKVTRKELIKFAADAGGYTIAMPRGAKLLLGDDLGGSIFACLGRHGFADSDVSPDVDWIGVNVDGNDRQFNGDAWGDFWQAQDHSWYRCNVSNLKGSAFNFTGVRRPLIKSCRIVRCGAGENGAGPIDWHHSDEGGTIGRLTEYGVLDDVWVLGSDDMAIQWWLTKGCLMKGVHVDQAYLGDQYGSHRSAFLGVDMEFCELADSWFLDGYEDCVTLKSRGMATSGLDGTFSHDNVLHGLVALGENAGAGGGGYFGIREFAQDGVAHAGNLISTDSIIGTVQRD